MEKPFVVLNFSHFPNCVFVACYATYKSLCHGLVGRSVSVLNFLTLLVVKKVIIVILLNASLSLSFPSRKVVIKC